MMPLPAIPVFIATAGKWSSALSAILKPLGAIGKAIGIKSKTPHLSADQMADIQNRFAEEATAALRITVGPENFEKVSREFPQATLVFFQTTNLWNTASSPVSPAWISGRQVNLIQTRQSAFQQIRETFVHIAHFVGRNVDGNRFDTEYPEKIDFVLANTLNQTPTIKATILTGGTPPVSSGTPEQAEAGRAAKLKANQQMLLAGAGIGALFLLGGTKKGRR